MSTRAERKARRNARRCRNCGEFGSHLTPWMGIYICNPKPWNGLVEVEEHSPSKTSQYDMALVGVYIQATGKTTLVEYTHQGLLVTERTVQRMAEETLETHIFHFIYAYGDSNG